MQWKLNFRIRMLDILLVWALIILQCNGRKSESLSFSTGDCHFADLSDVCLRQGRRGLVLVVTGAVCGPHMNKTCQVIAVTWLTHTCKINAYYPVN